MLKAQKLNRIIRIPDSQKAQYESLGYKITDMEGNIISAPVDKDAEIKRLNEIIKKLEAKIADLEDGIKEEAATVFEAQHIIDEKDEEIEKLKAAADAAALDKEEKKPAPKKKATTRTKKAAD